MDRLDRRAGRVLAGVPAREQTRPRPAPIAREQTRPRTALTAREQTRPRTAPTAGPASPGLPGSGALAQLEAAYEREAEARRDLLAGALERLFPVANRLESGSLVSLAHPALGRAAYALGMWAPDQFSRRIGGGVLLLEPFRPDADVLLLVHGINGGPRDYVALVAAVDRRRFQVWIAYYPTGLEITASAQFVRGALEELVRRHRPRRLVAIANSLGGLVWRALLTGAAGCPAPLAASYFVSSPQRGVKFHPMSLVTLGCRILMRYLPRPVDDLLEGSPFLTALDARPLPPHHWRTAAGCKAFTPRARLVSLLVPGTDDGLVPLPSTPLPGSLSHEVFAEDHYSILSAPAFLRCLSRWLDQDAPATTSAP
jgi:hypothetical protein